MIHISNLDFEVIDHLNPKILHLRDLSAYNPDLPIEQSFLQIRMPDKRVLIKSVVENFDIIYNSNDLGITTTSLVSSLVELPDGIYTIRYSICPNDELYVEFTFLRNVKQLIKYYNLYCKLDLQSCNSRTITEDLEKLKKIKYYIDAAKYKVDFCGDKKKGLELYDYAEELLNEFDANCECYG